MSAAHDPIARFELPAAAVASWAERHLGLRCSPLSPVAFLAAAHGPADVHVADDQRLRAALSAALQPEAVTTVRAVDAAGVVTWRALCQSRVALGDAVAACSLTPDGALRLEMFATPLDAVAAHTRGLLTAVSSVGSAPLPREWPVGAVIDALHALDRYRRACLEAALSGAPHGDVTVRARELLGSLQASLSSDDLRWLLPAFWRLAPGVRVGDVAASATQLGRLVSAGIFRPPEGPGDDPVLRFGDAGQRLGLEFARGWWGAAGVEHTLLLADGLHAMHRAFVASTALANHWFTLRDDADGHTVVDHEALTLQAAVEGLAERLAASERVAEMARTAGCPACGHAVTLGTARCRACGFVFGR